MNLQGYASVKVHVQYLTTADGLSNNSVRYIHQDSKGFIWMSSLNGLNRYDGYDTRIYRSLKDDGNSLPDSYIEDLSAYR
jgi:ligand-binding sensor domain-containing protein